MNNLDLESIKSYLSIDSDYHDEDKFLIQLLNMSQSIVDAQINGGCKDERLEYPESGISAYQQRKNAATLLILSELYRNRELQTSSNFRESPIWNMIISPLVQFGPF